MKYTINVSRSGKHLFVTYPNSLSDREKAYKLYQEFKEKFSDCAVQVTRYEDVSGYIEDWDEPEAEPERCFYCGEHAKPGEQGKTIRADMDPGDPENGPAPDIQDAWICNHCTKI